MGMGRDVAGEWESADKVFEIADECTGLPVRRLCFEGPAEELAMIVNLQPCVVATSIAMLAAACEEAGVRQPDEFDLRRYRQPPAFTAGHSVGEYSALAASGALSVKDCLELVAFRGRAMEEAGRRRPGTMLALLSGTTEAATRLCSDIRESVGGSYLDVANYNSPEQVVVAGDLESVALARRRASEYGFRRAMPLRVSGAFHTSAMLPASSKMEGRLLAVLLGDPGIPVVGNIEGRPLGDAAAVRRELSAQVASPVRWGESMGFIESNGVRDFVEVGPGQVLSRLAARSVDGAEAATAGDVDGVRRLARRLEGN